MLDKCIKELTTTKEDFKMKPPILVGEGKRRKKTTWTNYGEFCDYINRDKDHVY